jgi:ATP-dependent DNA helicase RecQ
MLSNWTIGLLPGTAQFPRTSANRSGASRAAASLSVDERARFERLRAWRADTSKVHSVPAYVVFHDATLAELARACPQSHEALSRISGVGEKKRERYGDALLELLKA